MRTLTFLWCSIGCMVLALGCGAGDLEGEDFAQSEEAVIKTNGIKLNGIKLNGIKLNGIKLNGIKLNGTTLSGVALSGSQLYGTKSGAQVAGLGMKGATLPGMLANGSPVTLTISAVSVIGDKYVYTVTSGGVSICGTGINAYALKGRWDESEGTSTGGDWINDSTTFTFACSNAALGKCVDMGYKPWTTKNGVSLRNYHQACTRAVRGDYCGDGRPYTVDGALIDIWDKVGIQLNSSIAANYFFMDAEWDQNGARCIQNLTGSWDWDRNLSNGIQRPTCYISKQHAYCGASYLSPTYSGSLILTEFYQSY